MIQIFAPSRRLVAAALTGLAASAVAFATGMWVVQAVAEPVSAEAASSAQASSNGGQSFTGADIKKLGIKLAKSDFPENGRGQTYGSMELSTTLKTMPDLVAVVGDNGFEGFVEKHHLVEPEPRNPKEAREIERSMKEKLPGPVPVYAVDGKTQLDVFTPFVAGME